MATSSEVSLRPVDQGDEEFLFALYRSTRAEEVAAWGWSEAQQDAFLKLQFLAKQQHYRAELPGLRSLIVLRGGQPIGWLVTIRGQDATSLAEIALLPEARNAGIGGGLIRAELATAAQAGLPLVLQVLRDSPAVRLYRRLGFHVVADDGLYLTMQAVPTTAR